jgi:hypothetical protein
MTWNKFIMGLGSFCSPFNSIIANVVLNIFTNYFNVAIGVEI